MGLSGNVEGTGMTEYINLEFSGNDKGDYQLTMKAIFARYYYYNYCCFSCNQKHYYYDHYYPNNGTLRENLN